MVLTPFGCLKGVSCCMKVNSCGLRQTFLSYFKKHTTPLRDHWRCSLNRQQKSRRSSISTVRWHSDTERAASRLCQRRAPVSSLTGAQTVNMYHILACSRIQRSSIFSCWLFYLCLTTTVVVTLVYAYAISIRVFLMTTSDAASWF